MKGLKKIAALWVVLNVCQFSTCIDAVRDIRQIVLPEPPPGDCIDGSFGDDDFHLCIP